MKTTFLTFAIAVLFVIAVILSLNIRKQRTLNDSQQQKIEILERYINTNTFDSLGIHFVEYGEDVFCIELYKMTGQEYDYTHKAKKIKK